MPLHISSTCAHHQEVKIALHSLWYHQTYWCDDTRDCLMQFWPPDDEHICPKYVEAWNKLILKQKFCASSWLITEINILRCTVSKTSKINACYIFYSSLEKKLTRFYFINVNILGSQCAPSTNDLVCYVGLKMTDWWVEHVALCINKKG